MNLSNNLKSLDTFLDEKYGKIGTKKRDKLEIGYENFKMCAFIKSTWLDFFGIIRIQLKMKIKI